MEIVTQQPVPPPAAAVYDGMGLNAPLLSSGPVTIRNLKDTESDAVFTGRIMVEAFEPKFIHCSNKQSVPAMKEYYARSQRGRPPTFYERDFIAEYNGEIAGSCVVRYSWDKNLFPDRSQDTDHMGCLASYGICCFGLATTEYEIAPGKCYVDHIGVDAKFRGKGIGKLLLDMAEVDAKKKGCKSIYLWVSTSNRAQHLYERQGYILQETATCCCCGLWCFTGEREFARMEKMLLYTY